MDRYSWDPIGTSGFLKREKEAFSAAETPEEFYPQH